MSVCVRNSGECFTERSHCGLCSQGKHCRPLFPLNRHLERVSVITVIHTQGNFLFNSDKWSASGNMTCVFLIMSTYFTFTFNPWSVMYRVKWLWGGERGWKRVLTYQRLNQAIMLLLNWTLGFPFFELEPCVLDIFSQALTVYLTTSELKVSRSVTSESITCRHIWWRKKYLLLLSKSTVCMIRKKYLSFKGEVCPLWHC